jgi:hypothetical protein
MTLSGKRAGRDVMIGWTRGVSIGTVWIAIRWACGMQPGNYSNILISRVGTCLASSRVRWPRRCAPSLKCDHAELCCGAHGPPPRAIPFRLRHEWGGPTDPGLELLDRGTGAAAKCRAKIVQEQDVKERKTAKTAD